LHSSSSEQLSDVSLAARCTKAAFYLSPVTLAQNAAEAQNFAADAAQTARVAKW
jgi:hypothetical protein